MKRTCLSTASVLRLGVTLVAGALLACQDSPPVAPTVGPPALAKGGGSGGGSTGGSKIAVKSADPDTIPIDTTVKVTILGSGFAPGATVEYLIGSQASTKIVADSVEYVSSRELRVRTTVAHDATLGAYDISVTSNGKRGIGAEMVEVVGWDLMALAVPPGTTNASANDINDRHEIVGTTAASSWFGRATYWPNGDDGTAAVVLPCVVEPCWSAASQINASGSIVGFIDNAAVRWDPVGAGWNLTTLTDSGRAWGIRDDGTVAGEFDRDGLIRELPLPVLWDAAGARTELPIPEGYYAGVAASLNTQGDVTGALRYRPPGVTGTYYIYGIIWVREGSGYIPLVLPDLVGGLSDRSADGSFRVASSAGRLLVSRSGGAWGVTVEVNPGRGNNLNAGGDMVGHVPKAGFTSKGQPYLYTLAGELVSLEIFPSALGTASAVSADRWVVGNFDGITAVLWKAR